MAKTTTPRKNVLVTANPKGKDRVIRLHLGTGRAWGGSMPMSSMARIMRESALDINVWSMVVDLSPKTITKQIASNAVPPSPALGCLPSACPLTASGL